MARIGINSGLEQRIELRLARLMADAFPANLDVIECLEMSDIENNAMALGNRPFINDGGVKNGKEFFSVCAGLRQLSSQAQSASLRAQALPSPPGSVMRVSLKSG